MDIVKTKDFLKNNWTIILILTLAFIIRVIFVFSSPVIWWDESVYSNFGHDLAINPFDYSFSDKFWTDWVPDGSWPKAGFRPPLLPYTLSLFYFLRVDFLIIFLMPVIGTISVFLVYLFGKKLFNKRAGLISALLLCLSVSHSKFSGRILTDVYATFFVILMLICFWKGYEENKNKYKLLFGLFFALGILSRYNMLWFLPVFFIYLLIRDKSLKFLKDKYLWYSLIIFIIVFIPWFVYGYSAYGNIFGSFIHASTSASFWGGCQSWYFYFQNKYSIYPVIGVLFLISSAYVFYKKEYFKKEVYLNLLLIIIFAGFMITMCHKEDRHILPIFPSLVLISGFFIDKLNKYWKIVMLIVIVSMIFFIGSAIYSDYSKSYNPKNICFLRGNEFLNSIDKSLVITDESPIIYYYTKLETRYYPEPWTTDNLRAKSLDRASDSYVFFTDFDMPLSIEKNTLIKTYLDLNFEKLFECENRTFIYKYKQ